MQPNKQILSQAAVAWLMPNTHTAVPWCCARQSPALCKIPAKGFQWFLAKVQKKNKHVHASVGACFCEEHGGDKDLRRVKITIW